MPSSSNEESELVTSTTEPKEVLKDEVVGENAIGTTAHLKCHYLIHGVRSQHLDATTVLL